MSLARGIQQKLHELQDRCGRAVVATERSGVRRPAHTVAGKLEQAQRWLANPAFDDKGLGRMIL
jgi:vinculin